MSRRAGAQSKTSGAPLLFTMILLGFRIFLFGSLCAAVSVAQPLPSAEMESVFNGGRVITLPGRDDAAVVQADGWVVDAGKPLLAVVPAANVRYLRLKGFTGWNDGLRKLVGSLPKL